MMLKRQIPSWFIAAMAILAGSACSDNITSPSSPRQVSVGGPRQSFAEPQETRVLHGKGTEYFILDHTARTLTNEAGRSVVVPQVAFSSMEREFDKINFSDQLLANLKHDPAYQRCVAKGTSTGLQLRTHIVPQLALKPSVSSVLDQVQQLSRSLGGLTQSGGLAPPSKPLLTEMSGDAVCVDLALAIKALDASYWQARQDYLDALKALEDLLAPYATHPLDQDLNTEEAYGLIVGIKAAALWTIQMQLQVLVDQYRMAGCSDPSSDGWGGGDASGVGGPGLNCYPEYIVIEISYDNGATWGVWWEGTATVCE